MEKKVILQVTDEGDGLRFQFEGKREEIFEIIGCIAEALHYQDIKGGACVKESMCDIRLRAISSIRKAFDNAHDRCRKEKENETNI